MNNCECDTKYFEPELEFLLNDFIYSSTFCFTSVIAIKVSLNTIKKINFRNELTHTKEMHLFRR